MHFTLLAHLQSTIRHWGHKHHMHRAPLSTPAVKPVASCSFHLSFSRGLQRHSSPPRPGEEERSASLPISALPFSPQTPCKAPFLPSVRQPNAASPAIPPLPLQTFPPPPPRHLSSASQEQGSRERRGSVSCVVGVLGRGGGEMSLVGCCWGAAGRGAARCCAVLGCVLWL